jgi:Tol biopolymer transport system component
VVFSWNGEKQSDFDIYIELIGSPTPVRLTTGPADDLWPAFSPDGRSIGFVRQSKEHAVFIVIPAIGGPERIVTDLPDRVGSFSWLPDGKWVVIDGLALLSTESGEIRSLTSPPTKSWLDRFPAVSPHGRTVAFSRSVGEGSDIYLLNLTDDLKPKSDPRRLTSLKGSSSTSAWTPNGREIICSSGLFGSESLWRVEASGTGEPEKLPYIGKDAFQPAISRSGNRLAYQHVQMQNPHIWRLSLSRLGVATGPPARFITSSRREHAAQYSPDGKRIAFESDRSGVHGIWVCDADGSNAVPLCLRAGVHCGTARWSPDGQHIAFDSDMEGNYDIYLVPESGGKPIRLTTDSADDWSASWSRKGNWVYFGSKRTGRWEVWKVPPGGGEAVQVTRNGGETVFESPDGKSLYYTKEWGSSGLWKMPVSGGEESQVLPSVSYRGFCLVNDGIYFIPWPGPDGKYSIQFLSFATSKVKTVAPMSGSPSEGLSVSLDGGSILFSQQDEVGSDLMLVENFR